MPNRAATSATRTPGWRMMYGTAARSRRSRTAALGVARGRAPSGTGPAPKERLEAGHDVVADRTGREHAGIRPERQHPGDERLGLAGRDLDLDPAVAARPDHVHAGSL